MAAASPISSMMMVTMIKRQMPEEQVLGQQERVLPARLRAHLCWRDQRQSCNLHCAVTGR